MDLDEIPIYIKRHPGSGPPDGVDFCYMVTKNGLFLYKKVGVVEAMIPVKEIPELAAQQSWARLNLEPIPMPHLAQILNFFRWVLKEKRGEAVVLLFYNPKKKIWKIVAPVQTVTPGSVNYEDGIQLGGHWLKVGTIHSHCDMAPFHSGGDKHDEMYFDGVHATFGHISRKYPGVSMEIVCNQLRFVASPEEYFAGVTYGQVEIPYTPPAHTPTASMHRRVGRKRKWFPSLPHTGPITPVDDDKSFTDVDHPTHVVTPSTYKADGLTFQFDDGESLEDYPFPEAWKEQVRTYEPPPPRVVAPIAARYPIATYTQGVLTQRGFYMTPAPQLVSERQMMPVSAFHSERGDFVFTPKSGRVMRMDVFLAQVRAELPQLESLIRFVWIDDPTESVQPKDSEDFNPGED